MYKHILRFLREEKPLVLFGEQSNGKNIYVASPLFPDDVIKNKVMLKMKDTTVVKLRRPDEDKKGFRVIDNAIQ